MSANRQGARRPLELNNAWKSYPEVKLKVENLPWEVTTWDLYRLFVQEGNIQRIEIIRGKATAAFVVFSPPPQRSFWQSTESIRMWDMQHNRHRKLDCNLMKERSFRHRSPVDPEVWYPERMKLAIESLDFGFMYQEDTMNIMRTTKFGSDTGHRATDLELALNLRWPKKLEVSFQLQDGSLGRESATMPVKYRFNIPVDSLNQIIETGVSAEERQLVISLSKPPEFYRKTNNVEATHDHKATMWEEGWTWLRQTDIVNDARDLSKRPIRLRKEHAIIDIGRWTTYRFRISGKGIGKPAFDQIKRALTDYSIPFLANNAMRYVLGSGKEAEIWTAIDLPTGNDSTAMSELMQLDTIHLPFPVRYQLEVCLSQGFINEHNITKEFVEWLTKQPEERARLVLEKVAENRVRYFNPMDIVKLRPTKSPKKRHPGGHYTYMRAAQITPSTVYYSTPILETSNRIIRHFSAHEDRFLRVKFVEETGRLRSDYAETQAAVFERILRALTHGIRIGDRLYEFLAFGNSQFREHGAYFFASYNLQSADDIRLWMGDFSHIHVVAKWASRLGQSFSTTRSIFTVKNLKVLTDVDIMRNGYNFTDGVGKMSTFLAQMVAREFGLAGWQENFPSVYQIRMGGCKGVLAVDPKMTGNEIRIRESQHKFAAVHEGLDICRFSAFAVAKLNRQIIPVLSGLGISDGIFLGMLENELSELARAMNSETLAVSLLSRRVDFNQMTLTLASMVMDGFMMSKDPFMMGILHLWRAWNVKYLKEKANITVDQGAFVLGCVDETASLKGWYEDNEPDPEASWEECVARLPEIFIQVQEPMDREADLARMLAQSKQQEGTPWGLAQPSTAGGQFTVKTGVCLLARNPSLHPGDVRVVRAVDVPDLHHLKDVVVLPQTGDRDLANMCSGGDLDGDDYIVIWDQNLIPLTEEWFLEAMDFSPPKPTPLKRAVTISDITEFFIKYIKSDRLPLIARSHMALADESDSGVFDEKCIELAQLHSCAVDFPKSGLEVLLPKRLRPRVWPHFLEKQKEKTYHSRKALGQMYDRVQLVNFKPDYEAAFDSRVLEAYNFEDESTNEVLKKAKEVKTDYDSAMKRIMAKHAIQTEFEVWSTFVLHHSRAGSDYKFHEEIGQLSSVLKERFREICIEEAGGRSFDKLGPWVAAMYKTTADEIAEAVKECHQKKLVGGKEVPLRKMEPKSMPLMSFPWIFHSELGKIATGRDSAARYMTNQAASKRTHGATNQAPAGEGLVMDLVTNQGVVHAGEELKLFDDDAASKEPNHAAIVIVQGEDTEMPKRQTVALPSGKHEDWAPGGTVKDVPRVDMNEASPCGDKSEERCSTRTAMPEPMEVAEEGEAVQVNVNGGISATDKLGLMMAADDEDDEDSTLLGRQI